MSLRIWRDLYALPASRMKATVSHVFELMLKDLVSLLQMFCSVVNVQGTFPEPYLRTGALCSFARCIWANTKFFALVPSGVEDFALLIDYQDASEGVHGEGAECPFRSVCSLSITVGHESACNTGFVNEGPLVFCPLSIVQYSVSLDICGNSLTNKLW